MRCSGCDRLLHNRFSAFRRHYATCVASFESAQPRKAAQSTEVHVTELPQTSSLVSWSAQTSSDRRTHHNIKYRSVPACRRYCVTHQGSSCAGHVSALFIIREVGDAFLVHMAMRDVSHSCCNDTCRAKRTCPLISLGLSAGLGS